MSPIATLERPASADVLAGLALPRPAAVPGLDDAAVLRLLTEVEAVGRRVDALRVALAGEVAERSRRDLGREGLAVRLGCRNAVELVQRTTGASSPTVNRRIRLGAATRASIGLTGAPVPPRFESVAAALDAGLLGFDSAAAIVDTLSPALRVAGARDVAVAEASLVAEAVAPDPAGVVPVDADSVRLQATVWHSVLDPDGAAPSERDVERRCLRLSAPRYGLVPVTGMLLPEVAGALQRYADACTNPRTAELPSPDRSAAPDGASADGATDDASTDGAACAACSETADPCAADGTDQRSRAQQLHDVLATIVHVAARAADAPSVAGNAPTLLVSVRAEDLVSGRGAAFADGVPTPISIAAARQIGCAGAVERIVVGRNGRILQLGSAERCFTGNQRRAIALRDGGCVIPGCHVPAGWCEVHHVTPHAHDPDGTHTDNGVLLCWFHHRTIDTSGWEIRMRNGVPEIKAPRWLDFSRAWRRAVGSPTGIAELCRIAEICAPSVVGDVMGVDEDRCA